MKKQAKPRKAPQAKSRTTEAEPLTESMKLRLKIEAVLAGHKVSIAKEALLSTLRDLGNDVTLGAPDKEKLTRRFNDPLSEAVASRFKLPRGKKLIPLSP